MMPSLMAAQRDKSAQQSSGRGHGHTRQLRASVSPAQRVVNISKVSETEMRRNFLLLASHGRDSVIACSVAHQISPHSGPAAAMARLRLAGGLS
jgi:hypothetical protein